MRWSGSEGTAKPAPASPEDVPGSRRDRYVYAGMAFILGILALVIGIVAYLLGRTLVGESLVVIGIVLMVAGFAGARLGGRPKAPG